MKTTTNQSLPESLKEVLEGTDVAMVAFESRDEHDRIWGTHQKVKIILRDSKGAGVTILGSARTSAHIERIVERVRVFGESEAEMRGILHLGSEVQAMEIRHDEELRHLLAQVHTAKMDLVLRPGFFDFCAWEVNTRGRGSTLMAVPRGDQEEFDRGVALLHEFFNYSHHDHSRLTDDMCLFVDDGVVTLEFPSFQALDKMRKQLNLDVRCDNIQEALEDLTEKVEKLSQQRDDLLSMMASLS